jgi:hypothetical protein
MIGLALYFSVATIIAIPCLRGFNDPSIPSSETLWSQFSGYALNYKDFDRNHRAELGTKDDPWDVV